MKKCPTCRIAQPLQNYFFHNGSASKECKFCGSKAIKFAPDEKAKTKAIKRISQNTVDVEKE